jgi:hypothetical protein
MVMGQYSTRACANDTLPLAKLAKGPVNQTPHRSLPLAGVNSSPREFRAFALREKMP